MSELSDAFLQEQFGPLDPADLEQIRREMKDEAFDPTTSGEVDRLLKTTAASAATDEAPPIPGDVLAFFEEQREKTQAKLDREEAALDATIYSQPRRYNPRETDAPSQRSWSRFLPGLAAAGIAAALAVAFLIRPDSPANSAPLAANSVSLLTPGAVTGFAEPTFTWKTDNGGFVDLVVREADSGAVVASLSHAYSPVRWSRLEKNADLRSGTDYEIEIEAGAEVAINQRFAVVGDAAGAPVPDESLEGIIQQCEGYIAANRPADAWMLWGELTAAQKSDPRMLELKDRILSAIAT